MNSWDETYIKIADEYAKHSKCAARKVACILVKDNNIVAAGVNGTLPGKTNCCDKFYRDWKLNSKKEWVSVWYEKINGEWKECENPEAHHEWSKLNESHAEVNALAKANQNGVSVNGSTAYVTMSPCYNCAKILATFGVKRIVFTNRYDDADEVIEYLVENDIWVTEYKKEE